MALRFFSYEEVVEIAQSKGFSKTQKTTKTQEIWKNGCTGKIVFLPKKGGYVTCFGAESKMIDSLFGVCDKEEFQEDVCDKVYVLENKNK